MISCDDFEILPGVQHKPGRTKACSRRQEVHPSRGLAGHKQRALRGLNGVPENDKIAFGNRVADVRISQEFPWIHDCDEPA